MSPSLVIAIVLLVLAIGLFFQSGRSRPVAIAFALAAWLAAAWIVAYLASDYFTGEGINEATLFHIRYGLRGSGFDDYRAVIGWSMAGLVLPAGLLAWLAARKNGKRRRWWLLIGGWALAAASIAVNPATADMVALLNPPAEVAAFHTYYRAPSLTPVSSEHPNLVYIYCESLERTYFDEKIFPGLIHDLRDLESEGTSFTNIRTVYGTGFTMGGFVGSMCGVPLITPAHPNSMSGMDSFLPEAIGLSDLLHDDGYHLCFMGGAYLRFGGKGKFLRTHGFDEALGYRALHQFVKDPTYFSAWGLYDDTLLDLAFQRFEELARTQQRFGLFLLTLDTHHPEGHLSKAVADVRYQDGQNPMLNAVAGSDRLLGQFVRRIQSSPAGRNTVIVLASDHIAMNNTASALLRKGRRRNLLLVLDPRHPVGVKIDRAGSVLDIGPTLLPFLGYRGDIGLGRNLRDPTVSDRELATMRDDATLRSWGDAIEEFWDFPHIKDAITFTQEPPTVVIDHRRFSAPVLIELDEDFGTTLRFEFDATYDVRLAQQAEQLANGTPYLFIAPREDALPLLHGAGPAPETRWVMVVGKSGLGRTAMPLQDGARFSKRQLEQWLARW